MTKSKHVRAGPKFTSKHTTVIEAAGTIADILERLPEVTKIALSIIVPKKGARGGPKRLKIGKEKAALVLKVSEGAVYQLIYAYGDLPKITKELSEKARSQGFTITIE